METNKIEFKPFDRVLVRDTDDQHWRAALYDQYRCYDGIDELYYPHRMVGEVGFKQCIPYEGNEYLLGTTDAPNPKTQETIRNTAAKWKPKAGERFYFILWDHIITSSLIKDKTWANNYYDKIQYENSNVFRTREEAQRAASILNEAWRTFNQNQL